jgi:hypothetical protein
LLHLGEKAEEALPGMLQGRGGRPSHPNKKVTKRAQSSRRGKTSCRARAEVGQRCEVKRLV